MFNIQLRGDKQLSARLGRLSPAIRQAARKHLAVIGENLATYGKTVAWEESGLKVRTGDLRRSMAAMPVTENEHGLQGGMLAGQGLAYGPIQEYGGIIRAKNVTFLTIPLDEALTASGVARFSARDAEAAGYRTFVRNHIIYGVKDGVLYPLFLLVPSVTIPATHFAGRILAPNRTMIERELKQAVDEGIHESKLGSE
jgi:hypothetical protein